LPPTVFTHARTVAHVTLSWKPYYYLSLHVFFFFNDTSTTEIYTLSLHDALPICADASEGRTQGLAGSDIQRQVASILEKVLKTRSEEHTSELQSRGHLVCRLLLEKKKYTRARERGQRQKTSSVLCRDRMRMRQIR